MNEPKNHHLLPAFYLQGFCDRRRHSKEGHDKDPRNLCNVYIHDRERLPDEQGRKSRLRGVNNVAVKKHFNSADVPGGGRDAEPEKKLAIIDGHASRILRDLKYGDALTKVDRAWLARFVAYSKFRTPSYRRWLEDFAQSIYPEMRKQYFPTLASIKKYLRAKGLKVDEIPDEAFKTLHRDIHEKGSALPVSKNYMLERMFEMGDKTATWLFGYDWTFAWADADTSFVTSDDPFLVLNEYLEAPAGFVGKARITTPNSKKVFPLSQEVCLIVGTGAPSVNHIKIDRPTVRKINLAQARHYDRWLVAKDADLCERFAHGDQRS